MGQVYQATDTKLNRQVALKILPEAFAADPDRLARFQREAQVLASLNHPGIAAIYGLEEEGDTRALVLELVEGPTLADRIAQGPIPVDEALPIAKQIAEALEAAHEQGIIHRDLKPANVKVKSDGTVKVLDFGLAKAFEPDASDASQSMSPTISLTAAATQMGMVIGTAAYMAPEQAKGKVVDKRADVWAFGAVLYEMFSGKKPFVGDDVSDTMALVLKFEPEWDALPADTPARLRQLMQTCLQKSPKQRVQAIGDVRLAMEGAFETTVTPPPQAPQSAAWRQAPPLVAAVLLAVIVGLVVWNLQPAPPPRSPASFILSAPPSAVPSLASAETDLAISPDGRVVAYRAVVGGEEGLYVRPVDSLEGELLPGTAGARSIFFSPDGTEVGFVTPVDLALKKVRVSGGPVSTVAFVAGPPRGASWGPDGTIIFARTGSGSGGNGLLRVSAAGGEPELLTTPEARGASQRSRSAVHHRYHATDGPACGARSRNWGRARPPPERDTSTLPVLGTRRLQHVHGHAHGGGVRC
jgi:serine/threonine-protein kinase